MTADEINGVDRFDEQLADDEHRMAVMDRLLSYAPAPASPLGPVMPVKSGTSAGSPVPGRGRAVRIFTGDEARVQMALRPRSGNVLPMGARRMSFVPVSLEFESFNNNGPTAGTGRAA